MKRITALILAALTCLSLVTLAACNKQNDETQPSDNVTESVENQSPAETYKTVETLNGKTPMQVYNEAFELFDSSEKLELHQERTQVVDFEGEDIVDTDKYIYIRNGADAKYSWAYGTATENFVYKDGMIYYEKQDGEKENYVIPTADYEKGYDSSLTGRLIKLDASCFEGSSFREYDDYYSLDLTVPKDIYKNLTGSDVARDVSYVVNFKADGALISLRIEEYYTTSGGYNIQNSLFTEFKKIGDAEDISKPADADSYAYRPAMSELDMSEVSADKISVSETETNYVIIDIKDYGKITVRLYDNVAVETVKNFKKLVSDGFYDGLTFHRVIKDFMIQGGNPKGDGTGGSPDKIKGEFLYNGYSNFLSHKRGVISMARSSEYDSASSQFFIMHKDNTGLDGQYAAFGYVVNGIEVVDAVAAVTTNNNDKPATDVVINSIKFASVAE